MTGTLWSANISSSLQCMIRIWIMDMVIWINVFLAVCWWLVSWPSLPWCHVMMSEAGGPMQPWHGAGPGPPPPPGLIIFQFGKFVWSGRDNDGDTHHIRHHTLWTLIPRQMWSDGLLTRLSLTALPSSRPQPTTAATRSLIRQLTMDRIVLYEHFCEEIKTVQTKTSQGFDQSSNSCEK